MSALAHALAEEGRPDDIFTQVARIQSERDAARAQVTALQEANNRAVDESRAARHAADFLRERICALALALDAPDFQPRTDRFMQACFGAEIAADRLERGDRAAEEFFEMLQATDYPRERLLSLIAYVWSRPVGDLHQEVGGVMVTLAAFCQAHDLNMHEAGEVELARVWTKIETIRAKQAAKPTGSALPQAWPVAEGETYVPAGQLDRDIGILLAQIDWLAECSGEGPEGEDAALVAQIRRDHEARKAAPDASDLLKAVMELRAICADSPPTLPPPEVTVVNILAAVQELYGVEALDKVTGRAIERAGYTLPGSTPALPLDSNQERCPICTAPFQAGETCATDITEGTCHAACLEGSPAVDLTTGALLEGPIGTFPWALDPAPPPEPAKAEVVEARKLLEKAVSALDYFADAVFNDNGDMTVTGVSFDPDKHILAYQVRRRILSALATPPTAPAARISQTAGETCPTCGSLSWSASVTYEPATAPAAARSAAEETDLEKRISRLRQIEKQRGGLVKCHECGALIEANEAKWTEDESCFCKRHTLPGEEA